MIFLLANIRNYLKTKKLPDYIVFPGNRCDQRNPDYGLNGKLITKALDTALFVAPSATNGIRFAPGTRLEEQLQESVRSVCIRRIGYSDNFLIWVGHSSWPCG